MKRPAMGGKPRLSLLVAGSQDAAAAVLPPTEGGLVEPGLARLIVEAHDNVESVLIEWEPGTTTEALAGAMASGATRVAEEGWDAVLLGIGGDLGGGGIMDRERFREALRRVIEGIKESHGAHVIVFNVSSVDPDDRLHVYHGLVEDPFSVRAHKANLSLLELSYEEGISIIDVDRIVSELGGDTHVQSPMRYSAVASEAICREVLRVMEDIGFFEARPMLAQVGQKGR